MAQDIKLNGVTFAGVDYIYVPKAYGNGTAVYRDLSNYHSGLNLSELLAGSATDINDANGEITGNLSSTVFNDYASLVSINFPSATSTTGDTFRSCDNLETAKMHSCQTLSANAFRECPKLTLAELDSVKSFGQACFYSSSNFSTLVTGKVTVPSVANDVFTNTAIASGNGAIYAYSDWISLFRTNGTWANYAAQMSIAEAYYDPTAVEYKITVTPPANHNPYIEYTTSKGTWYGRDRSIAGGETDTLSYTAHCYGFVDKTGTVSISSSSTDISIDLSDMVADVNFNGFNITSLNFTNAEVVFSSNSTLAYNNFSDWYSNIHSTNGIGGFSSSKYLNLTQTIPSTSEMTKPTIVWEALVNMDGTEASARKTIYSCSGNNSNNAIIQVGATDVNLYRSGTNNVVSDLDLMGGWHHIGVVVNATNSYIYVDGELKSTITDSGMYAQFTASSQRVGERYSSSSDYFLGHAKELVVCLRDISDPTVVSNCEFVLLSEIE